MGIWWWEPRIKIRHLSALIGGGLTRLRLKAGYGGGVG